MLTPLLALALVTLAQDDEAPAVAEAATTERAPFGMVIVPGGTTIVGTDVTDIERLADRKIPAMHGVAAETPRHTVEVATCLLDRTELTNLQWQVYLDATGQRPSADLVRYGWKGTTIPEGREQHPVSGIGWREIRGYLAWCGKRLPTEFEWVRGARGDDDRMYPWGPRWDSDCAWSANSEDPDDEGDDARELLPRTTGVDDLIASASPFDLQHMAGNVCEWTSSPFSAYPGHEAVQIVRGKSTSVWLDPGFRRDWLVVKGGSGYDVREDLRLDARVRADPGYDLDSGWGFRAARTSLDGGREALEHGYARLLSSRLMGSDGRSRLDLDSAFSRASTAYDSARGVITGFRCLAFAPVGPWRDTSTVSNMLRDTVDAPLSVGLLVSTEPLAAPDLPPGAYVVVYKREGRSAADREERRNRDDLDTPDESDVPLTERSHDVDYPRNEDVYLFLNRHGAVVGWTPAPTVQQRKPSPLEVQWRDEQQLRLTFTLDGTHRGGREARFELPLVLAAQGI